MIRIAAFALLLSHLAAAAQSDPLKSPACGIALDELAQARVAAEQDPRLRDRVERLRKNAASTCLGATDPAQPSGRVAQQPQRVPPPVIVPPGLPFPTVQAPPPPAAAIPRPPVITSCDPGGCWDSNGTRLNRAGPNLIGPNGLCTASGALLNCP